MKNNLIKYASSTLAFLALTTGCSLFGANPKAPSSFEANAFNITTNVAPQVVTQTNVVTTTNVVNVPTPMGVPVYSTNVFSTTNVVTLTNQVEQYQFSTKPATVEAIKEVAAATGPFTAGIGTMIGSGLVALYGLWAQLRSNKKGSTSLALTQEIEAIRDFILTLPQGTKIDAAVTQFMQQHQTEAGVVQEVLGLIKGNSSNPTATGVAAVLQEAINVATATTPPKT